MSKFDEFWQHCPKKVGKIACRKSYQRQVRILERERPDVEPHEFLVDAMKRYRLSQQVKDGYVTNPLTWLNEGRYYDEDDSVQQKSSTTRMDDTTLQELARARQIKLRKANQKPLMNFDLTKAFDPGWRPPQPWYFPLADPIRRGQ